MHFLIFYIDTTHRNHGYDLAKHLPLEFDAIVTLSGDGLIHEVINGFAHHEQPDKAFAIPIAPIPTGSGNGLSLNLLGINVCNSTSDVLHAFMNDLGWL